MTPRQPLPFDPIERAAGNWQEQRWGDARRMRLATSIMRAQQILINAYDDVLRPHGLTFARFEALALLQFSQSGALPMKIIGDRLQVLADYPVPPNCTSPFAPAWIAEMVRRQG